MPTQEQIQDKLFSARQQMATLVLANANKEAGGCNNVNWFSSWRYFLTINAVQNQYNLGDFTSKYFIKKYNCLCDLVGLDTETNTIDPNFQMNNGIISVVVPVMTPPPIEVTWDVMSTDNSPDGGVTRNTYYNSAWKGFNPFMVLTSPQLTGLVFGTDYILVPSGGFILSDTGNLPGIVEGQFLTVFSYALYP
jgi:hypothetical protein